MIKIYDSLRNECDGVNGKKIRAARYADADAEANQSLDVRKYTRDAGPEPPISDYWNSLVILTKYFSFCINYYNIISKCC